MRRLRIAVALLAVVPCFAATVRPEAERGALRFVAPRDLSTVLGPATFVLAVEPPEGAQVVRVEVTLDAKPLVVLEAPPWTATWDAGENGGNHRLSARAILSDGRELQASVRTSPLRVDQVVEVALVNVYAIAKDGKGDYVRDLRAEEMRLFENGRLQAIDRFSAERKPLRVALVLDTSLSMRGEKMDEAKRAALEFLGVLQPGDEAMVVAFSDRVEILRDMTGDRGDLENAVRSVVPSGGTALYDAIWTASERLAPLDARRVIVLLSDGKDEAASGLEPGSLHTFDEAIDRSLRSEAMIFAIGLGGTLARDARRLESDPKAAADEMDFHGRKPLAAILKEFSDSTGGRAIFTSSPGRVRRAFEEVAEDLRHQYVLAYAPDDRRHDGSWREIRVQSTREGVSFTNRSGYYAPKDRATR
jgi:VWFA-related protein